MLEFKGKHVLVTGGSRGIGAATVELLASLNADVAFNFQHDKKSAHFLLNKISKYSGKHLTTKCDINHPKEIENLVQYTIDELGGIDIFVNNAGIWEYGGPVETMNPEIWNRTIRINLDAAFHFTRLVAGHMKNNKQPGRIIFVASTAGQRGEPFYSNYAATKGAIISFTKSLAAELGPFGILVNCVAPGWVSTDMTREAFKSQEEEIRSAMATGKIPAAEDIAGPIVFLASELAGAITGEILNVNAGSVMCG